MLARVVGTLAPLQLVKTSLGDWLREPRFIAAFCSCVSLRCTRPAHSRKLPSASRVAGRPISPFVDDSVLPDELRAQPSLRGAAVALVSSTPVTHYFATAATWLEVCVRAAAAAFGSLHLPARLLHGAPQNLCSVAPAIAPSNPEPPVSQTTFFHMP